MTTLSPLLSLRNLVHRYGSQAVLNVHALTLQRGEVALLVGNNGAGKTTLLRILAGLLPPSECDFFAINSGSTARAPAVMYLHQTPYLFSTSVRANVQYGLRRCGLPLQAAEEAMEWAGVAAVAHLPAAKLSGGEQRRVALARIRALRPQLYLLDEPLTHLDGSGKACVHSLIADLQQEGAAAVISAHHQEVAATQVWTLQNGEVSVTAAADAQPPAAEASP